MQRSLHAFTCEESSSPAGQTTVGGGEPPASQRSHQARWGGQNSVLIKTESLAYACWSGVMILLAYVTAFQVSR